MEQELKEARERIAKLEACLIRVAKLAWSAVKDERDAADQRLNNLQWTLEEMQKVGLDSWLPNIADMAGILNKPGEILIDERKRREAAAIETMLTATV